MDRKNKPLNKMKIFSTLGRVKCLDKEKQFVFDNMKNDFEAHLSDIQSDRNDRHRRTTAAIRQSFQSILMQIPSNIQNLNIDNILSKGGSLELTDGHNEEMTLSIDIPKSMLSSTTDLSQVMSHKKHNGFKESVQHKLAAVRNITNKKAVQTSNSRVITRSTAKKNGRSDVFDAKTDSQQMKPTEDNEKILRTLSTVLLKPPRKANPNEEIITLAFSSAGTPLLVEDKSTERITKTNY